MVCTGSKNDIKLLSLFCKVRMFRPELEIETLHLLDNQEVNAERNDKS